MFGFQRLEWYGSTNDLLHTDYGESMYIGYNLYYNFEYKMMSGSLGLTTAWGPNTGSLSITSGNYINFSLPLNGFYDTTKIHWEKIQDAQLIKMYFRNLVSSGSGTLNLVNMSLEFDIEQDSDDYRVQVDKLYDNNILRT